MKTNSLTKIVARCNYLWTRFKEWLGPPGPPALADGLVGGGGASEMTESMLSYVQNTHEAWLIGNHGEATTDLTGTPGVQQFLFGDPDDNFPAWDIQPAIGNSPFRQNSRLTTDLLINNKPFVDQGWTKTSGGIGGDVPPVFVNGEIHFTGGGQDVRQYDIDTVEGKNYVITFTFDHPIAEPESLKGPGILLGYDQFSEEAEEAWYHTTAVGRNSKSVVLKAGPQQVFIITSEHPYNKTSSDFTDPLRIISATVREWAGDSLLVTPDQSGDLEELVDEARDLLTYAKGIESPLDQYDSFAQKGRDDFDQTSLLSEDHLDDFMSEYSRRSLGEYMQAINRFTAGMADINAVQTSAFVQGLLLMELDYLREMNTTRGRIRLQREEMRLRHTQQAAQTLVQMLNQGLRLKQGALQALVQAKTHQVVAQTEYEDNKADVAFRDAKWDLDILTAGANMMSAPQGVAHVTPGRSRGANALSNALSAAAMMGGMAMQGGWDLGLGALATGGAAFLGGRAALDPWARR